MFLERVVDILLVEWNKKYTKWQELPNIVGEEPAFDKKDLRNQMNEIVQAVVLISSKDSR